MCKYKAWVSKKNLSDIHLRTCLLGISINNPRQTGEKLKATINWINENFQECLVGISDTLHVPNYKAQGYNETTAKEMARKAGDDWLKTNEHPE